MVSSIFKVGDEVELNTSKLYPQGLIECFNLKNTRYKVSIYKISGGIFYCKITTESRPYSWFNACFFSSEILPKKEPDIEIYNDLEYL